MKNGYIIDYLNENEFRKKERSVKKYNMLAYKKLIFDYYPQFREGKFEGVIKSVNKQEKITKYELKLPTDTMFAKVHGDMMLHYSVYENQGIVFLETITPEDILAEGHQSDHRRQVLRERRLDSRAHPHPEAGGGRHFGGAFHGGL